MIVEHVPRSAEIIIRDFSKASFRNPGKPILVIRADGTLERGSDRRPIKTLTKAELLKLFEQLVELRVWQP